MVYSEEHDTKREAQSREWYIRHAMNRKDKLKLIEERGR